MERFSDKKILVVGGASGIGREIATAFGDEGGLVCVADLNEPGGRETVAMIESRGGQGWFAGVDVRDESSVEEMVGSAVAAIGGLDILVNVAGVLKIGLVDDLPTEDWDQVFDVNIRGQYLTVKHSLRALRQSEGAVIVNIASAAGYKDGSGNTAYSASKGAVITFSKTLAMELAPVGIRVNAICPGFIDTPFNAPAYEFMGGMESVERFVEENIPLRRKGQPAEVANYVLFMSSDDASFITGQAPLIDGGMI